MSSACSLLTMAVLAASPDVVSQKLDRPQAVKLFVKANDLYVEGQRLFSNKQTPEGLQKFREAAELYEPLMKAVRDEVTRRAESGFPPERIADGIAHALTAKRPKTRYLIGPWARTQMLMVGWMPDRLRDWVLTKALGLS